MIPADDKWYSRLAIAAVIHRQLKALQLHYPKVTEAKLLDIQKAKEAMLAEDNGHVKREKKKNGVAVPGK